MQHFLLGLVLGALVAVTVGVPFFAPWSIRVRFLAAAPMTDPWIGLDPTARLERRMVRINALECRAGDVDISFEELGAGSGRQLRLAGAGCPPGVVAKLDGWMATRMPLLVVTDEGDVELCGPDGVVTDLRPARERV